MSSSSADSDSSDSDARARALEAKRRRRDEATYGSFLDDFERGGGDDDDARFASVSRGLGASGDGFGRRKVERGRTVFRRAGEGAEGGGEGAD